MKRIYQIKEIPQNSHVFLYGACLGGKIFLKKIKQHRADIKILGFIDDYKSGEHNGLRIFKLNDILKDFKFDYIIITSIYEQPIIERLSRKGIKSVLTIDKNMINPLSTITTTEVVNLYTEIYNDVLNLLKTMNINRINPEDIIKLVEVNNILWDLNIIFKDANFKLIFEKYLRKGINNLAIYPCTIFVENTIEYMKKYFETIEIYDDYRSGEVISGITIKNTLNIEQYDKYHDAYFITTRIPELKNYFLKTKAPKDKTIWINDIIYDFYPKKKQFSTTFVDTILNKINNSVNPIIVLGGKYYNNYTPTFKALERKGYEIFLISRIPEVSHAYPYQSYKLLPFKNKYVLDIHQLLYFAKNLTHGTVLMHSEGFLNPQFDGLKTIACYVYPLAILKGIKVKKILFLYDLIKPFYKNYKYENEFLKIYKELLNVADKIILNSNTEEALFFLENAFDFTKPKLSFYRYNFKIRQSQPKLTDGFHIVMVGGFLDDVGDEMRTISEYVKLILAQGIHIHYYVNSFGVKAFKQTLDSKLRKYFHIEKTIMEQNELLYDVSKYHAGWMVHNTQKISNMISKAKNQFFKDILYIFMETTVPSSVLLFGSAGLPMFINRSMHGLIREFPEEFFIPIELSEIRNIIKIIKAQDWTKRYNFCNAHQGLFSIETNIKRLINFIEN